MKKRVVVPIDLGGNKQRCLLTSPQRNSPEPEFIEAMIHQYLNRYSTIDEVSFVQGTPTDAQLNACGAHAIRLTLTPKNALSLIEDNLLSDKRIQCVEIEGLSFSDSVLFTCKREYTGNEQEALIQKLKNHGLRVGYIIATGLPGSSSETQKNDAQRLSRIRPNFVRIYPTQAWKGSLLAEWAKRGKWGVNDQFTLFQVRDLMSFFEMKKIPIARVGLQAGHDVTVPVVLGPRTDNLRMRVAYLQFFDKMAAAVALAGIEEKIELRVNPKDLAYAKGVENDNIRLLRSRLGHVYIGLGSDPCVMRGSVMVQMCGDQSV
jgi:histone acetyltransferase (RNA polymerase elongator complex component)